MKTSEIIDGLEDLIQDRKSFVTPANDKFYGEDNPFKYDIAVLKAAIDKLSRRAEPENKALTCDGCINDRMQGDFRCATCSRLKNKYRNDNYAHKPEGSETLLTTQEK